MPSQGFIDDFEKGDIVAFFLEQRQPGDGAIERVIDVSAGSMACGTWHEEMMTGLAQQVKRKLCVPFSDPLVRKSQLPGSFYDAV
jgi:hypothetical protein